MTTHEQLNKTALFNEQEDIEIKSQRSLDFNSNESITFCRRFRFDFVSSFCDTTGNAHCNVCK